MTTDGQITFVYFDDPDAARDFFERALGLRVARRQPACWIFQTAPGAYLGACARLPGRPTGPPNVTISLVVADVDRASARLRDAGVEIIDGPVRRPEFGIDSAFLRGPEGLRLELQSFHDPL